MKVNLNRVNDFNTDDPKLYRQLSSLEGNVAQAVSDFNAQAQERSIPTGQANSNVQAQFGQIIPVNTKSGSTIRVQLPNETKQDLGRMVIVERLSALGTVVIQSLTSIDGGAASQTLPATVGVYSFICDGA